MAINSEHYNQEFMDAMGAAAEGKPVDFFDDPVLNIALECLAVNVLDTIQVWVKLRQRLDNQVAEFVPTAEAPFIKP